MYQITDQCMGRVWRTDAPELRKTQQIDEVFKQNFEVEFSGKENVDKLLQHDVVYITYFILSKND